MSSLVTKTIIDAVGRVIATVIDGHVWACGVTADVTTAEPLVVPLADDFTESGFPGATVALAPWKNLAQPMQERLHLELLCAVWRSRVPLGENVNALYDDFDKLRGAFIAHAKLFVHEPAVQSALLLGGPGIEPRAVPRLAAVESDRLFLTLPFRLEVVTNVVVTYQPA